MMFNKGDAYDLWWTGQEFKDMRLESCEQMLNVDQKILDDFRNEKFDLAIGHFHDICPLALAEKVGITKVAWITHGTSGTLKKLFKFFLRQKFFWVKFEFFSLRFYCCSNRSTNFPIFCTSPVVFMRR